MKKSFLFFTLLCFAVVSMAQSSQIATLNHGGTISTYYGADAFVKAHTEAVEGDVITLSAGSFNGTNLSKAITLRGAGAGMDSVNTSTTYINSAITINIPASSNNLIMEGINFRNLVTCKEATNPQFLKCRFYSLSGTMNQASILHCKINSLSNSSSLGGMILNSVVGFYEKSSANSCTFTNCVVRVYGTRSQSYETDEDTEEEYVSYYSYHSYIKNNTFYNSIIRFEAGYLGSSNLAYNCIGIIKDTNDYATDENYADDYNYYGEPRLDIKSLFEYMPIQVKKTNFDVDNFTQILKSGQDIFVSDDETYELTEKAKAYKGNDGTELGIYGGQMPFDPRTTTPQITKCNVAAKSTADGKLSVDIEVTGIE